MHMSDPLVYWESKFGVAECALLLFSVCITEAAVDQGIAWEEMHLGAERTFHVQKFVDTPLRNALQNKVVQAMLLHVGENEFFS